VRCEDAQREIALARYGQPLADAAAEHAAQCKACRALTAREKRLDELLSTDADEPPRPGFDTRFFARLDEEKQRQTSRGERSRLRFLWALVPLAAGVAIALVRSPAPPPPPGELAHEDLALAMDLELVEELPMLRQLDELEAYEVLSQLNEDELEAMAREVQP
jgi:hypothetical protein